MTPPHRIAIIGGGIAGLTVGYRLRDAAARGEIRVEVFEASAELGGKIRTERFDGFVVERGPDSMLATKPWGVDLAVDLGIDEELQLTDTSRRRAFVLRGDRLHPLPEGLSGMVPTRLGPLFRSRLLSVKGRARAAFEPWIPRRTTIPGRTAIPRRTAPVEEAVGAFIRRRFGTEAYDWLVQPLLTGIYGGGGEELGIESAFPALAEAERNAGSVIRGLRTRELRGEGGGRPTGARPAFETPFIAPRAGMGRLIEALTDALHGSGVRLSPGTAVSAVHGLAAGGLTSGFSLELSDGRREAAEVVVCAAPAPATAPLLAPIDEKLALRVAAIAFGSVAVVTTAFPAAEVVHPLDGYGFLIPERMERTVMACTWTTSKFSGRAPMGSILLRTFVREGSAGVGHDGERGADPNEAAADADLLAAATEELRSTLGILAPPAWSWVDRWPLSMPRYTVGHAERVSEIEAGARTHPGLFLTGHSYRGVGIPDTIRAATETAAGVLEYISSNPVGSP